MRVRHYGGVAAIVIGGQFMQVIAQTPNNTLLPWAFKPLPVGSVQPRGWLSYEVASATAGLGGHLDRFYEYVNDSRWLVGPNGTDYSNLNEALPYWFNGLAGAAYLDNIVSISGLDLKDQIHAVADTILSSQTDDGWIGPESLQDRNFWARTPFFLGLTQLAEVNATGWENRVVTSLRRFMVLANSMLNNGSDGFTQCNDGIDCRWGQIRVHDLIITIQWLLENHPSTAEDDGLLWETMELFYNQSEFKWDQWYSPENYQPVPSDTTPNNPNFPYLHGVNVGQGLKASAVIRRFTHNDSLIESSIRAVNWTFLYHGSPSGTVLGDEIVRDRAPYMGSELCTVVETAFSMEYLYLALGTSHYADRAETAVFNALPAAMFRNPDHNYWAHQYMDQPNGPWTNQSAGSTGGIFTTSDFGIATRFGMEPQYPCCTVNHPQGFPKFVHYSWARAGDSGLVHALFGPSQVTTTISGHRVSIECDTAYPFDNKLAYSIQADAAFDLYLRIPSWVSNRTAPDTRLAMNGAQTGSPGPSVFNDTWKFSVPAGNSSLDIVFAGLRVRTESRSDNAISVYVGNILFGLDVGASVTSSFAHPFYDPNGPGDSSLPFKQLRDYYITNTTAWNVAIDPTTLQYHPPANPSSIGASTSVFDYASPPSHVSVEGCEIEWPLLSGATPDIVPAKPACLGGKSTYRLIPYGATKVRMSELAVVDLSTVPEALGGSSGSSFRVQRPGLYGQHYPY